LGAQGLTLGHRPEDFETSTLGGWIAGGGRCDWLRGVTVATPQGLLSFGASQAGGPDLTSLMPGSRGTLGVITRAKIRIQDTLFIVASKSGATTETLSHFAYFWDQIKASGRGAMAGWHFAAITDPGTSLEQLAKDHGFRWIFPNPPDIGGRYSALSYFGLVPGALMGVNVVEMLERAVEMAHSCADSVPVATNPGAWLGAVIGQLAVQKRNKLTLIASPKVATFATEHSTRASLASDPVSSLAGASVMRGLGR